MAFDPVRFGAALLQLGFGLLFALVAVYLGVRMFDRMTRHVDEIEELKRGNVAVGVLLAAVVFSIATVVRSGVEGLTEAFLAVGAGATMREYAAAVGAGLLQLLVGLLLATAAIRVAAWVFDQVTQGLDEEEEIRRGNVAVAIVLGGVLVSVASVIASGVGNLAASLTL